MWRSRADEPAERCGLEPMTPSSNRIFDELARFATDAAGAAQGARREGESLVPSQVERLIPDMAAATRGGGEAWAAARSGGSTRIWAVPPAGGLRVPGRW